MEQSLGVAALALVAAPLVVEDRGDGVAGHHVDAEATTSKVEGSGDAEAPEASSRHLKDAKVADRPPHHPHHRRQGQPRGHHGLQGVPYGDGFGEEVGDAAVVAGAVAGDAAAASVAGQPAISLRWIIRMPYLSLCNSPK